MVLSNYFLSKFLYNMHLQFLYCRIQYLQILIPCHNLKIYFLEDHKHKHLLPFLKWKVHWMDIGHLLLNTYAHHQVWPCATALYIHSSL